MPNDSINIIFLTIILKIIDEKFKTVSLSKSCTNKSISMHPIDWKIESKISKITEIYTDHNFFDLNIDKMQISRNA